MKVTLKVSDPLLQKRWSETVDLLHEIEDHQNEIVLCDPLSMDDLHQDKNNFKSTKKYTVLVITEKDRLEKLTKLKNISLIDDFIVEPIRLNDVFLFLRRMDLKRAQSEIEKLNIDFTENLSKLREDLKLAERLQKDRLPVKFGPYKGIKIRSRYLAGVKSGGDYFDIVENEDQSKMSILMSDSSSYGLSSALLTSLMRMTVYLGREANAQSREVVRGIHSEILRSMKEDDYLSFFYGSLSKKDYKLRYIHYGKLHLFHAKKGEPYVLVEGLQSPYLSKEKTKWWDHAEKEISLNADDKLFLCSDGYVEAAKGTERLLETLNAFREKESVDLLNELSFYAKGKLDQDEMPNEDSSALFFEVENRILKLA